MSTCARNCWIFAAVMGVLVLALSSSGVGLVAGLFLGLVTAGLLGALLTILFCQGADDVEEWPRTVDSAKDPDGTGARSIRRDGGAVAQVPVARPQRPEGMEGAPQGASGDPAEAVTFTARDDAGEQPAKPARKRPRKDQGVLAETPKTAHSGSVGQSESL